LTQIKVIILGSSAPSPSTGGFASVLVIHGRDGILLDAGEGTQERVFKAGFSLAKIRKIFITHLHGDHVLGLVPLLQSRSLMRAVSDIEIYGPPGIREYIESNLKYLNFSPNYDIKIFEGLSYEHDFGLFKLKAIPLNHGIPTTGYRLDFKKGSIGYITDTIPLRNVTTAVKEVDLLIHDSTFSVLDGDKAEEYMHSTAGDAAKIAKEAEVGMLLLFHISPRYKDKSVILDEARSIFRDSYLAEDYTKVVLLKK